MTDDIDEVLARVAAFLDMKEPHPFQEQFSDVHTLDVDDLRALVAEVERLRATQRWCWCRATSVREETP